MSAEQWYVITYDIADKRRLRRTHSCLRAMAYPIQESVFLWAGNAEALEHLHRCLLRLIRSSVDDVRLFPVNTRFALQFWGCPAFLDDIINNDLPEFQNNPPGIWLPGHESRS